jgi:hypothetical protein
MILMAPKSRPSCFWVFVFPLGLAACLGYRTPLDDPSATNAQAPVFHDNPDADARASDAPADLARADRPTDLARADVSADLARLDTQPDLRRDDAPADLTRADRPTDLARRDTQPDLESVLARADASTLANCLPGNQYIQVLGGNLSGNAQFLYSLDLSSDPKNPKLVPPLGFTLSPLVHCSASTLNSMTVSPIGPAYISTHAGDLCSFDLGTAKPGDTTISASLTGFEPARIGNKPFGMALLPDNSSPAGQKLYVAVQNRSNSDSEATTNTLWWVDLTDFAGFSYEKNHIGDIQTDSYFEDELTAGPDGELYGYAVGYDPRTDAGPRQNSLLLTINPKTAAPVEKVTVPENYERSAFALVAWEDAFYLFVSGTDQPGQMAPGSQVYRYVKGDTKATKLGEPLSDAIIGAGVACRR